MTSEPRRYHRPTLLGPAAIDTRQGEAGPRERQEAAHSTARLLVLGARESEDPETVRRLLSLTDDHGLELLAQLWADAPPESLPGALWRLYAIRDWVHRDPAAASREFREGRRSAPVHEAVAGVADPPGPDEVRAVADAILTGAYTGDFAVALERAAAFARVVAVGRAHHADLTDDGEAHPTRSAARLVRTAEQLEAAAHGWRTGHLQAP